MLSLASILAGSFAGDVVPRVGSKPGFPPALRPGCLAPDDQANLYCPGDEGYGCYKIPTILRTRNNTLLAMIEARKNSCDDQGYVDLRLRRSFDGGKTWAPSQLVHGNSTDTHWTTVGDGNMVQDKSTGIIWLLHTRNNSRLFLSHSKDEGASWTGLREVTEALKFGYPTQNWIGTGHAGGIQLSRGASAGRLIIPTYTNTSCARPPCPVQLCSPAVIPRTHARAHACCTTPPRPADTVYSDDHGATWRMGGTVNPTGEQRGGECQMAETGAFAEDGTPILLFSMRPPGVNKPSKRLQALSFDGGLSWGQPWEAKDLPEPIRGCDGSLVYHPVRRRRPGPRVPHLQAHFVPTRHPLEPRLRWQGTHKLYFSHPDPFADLFRVRLRVWTSANLGSTWEDHTVVWQQAAGYSALALLGDPDTGMENGRPVEMGVYYDRNNHTMPVFEAQEVSFKRFAA